MRIIKKKEIEKVAARIAKNYKPHKIYLFGSFAWGKPTVDSDVDLFIVKETKKKWLQRQLEARRNIDDNVPVDLLVYTPKEVERRLNLGDFFVEDIVQKGKLLYESQ